MAPDHLRNLEAGEAAATVALEPILRAFRPASALTDQVLRAISSRVHDEMERSPAHWVQGTLVARLADDVRCFWLLRTRGYGVSSWAIAATVLEVAATSGFIAFDSKRASDWVFWDELRRTPWPISDLIAGAVENWHGGPDNARVTGWRNTYTLWCMGKHANTRLQLGAYAVISPFGRALEADPTLTPEAHKQLAIDLYSLLPVSLLALAPLSRLAPAELEPFLAGEISRLSKEIRQTAVSVFKEPPSDL